MLALDFDNNQGAITALALITAVNVGVIISLLIANTVDTGFVLSGNQLYALVGVELAGIFGAYVAGKRTDRNRLGPMSPDSVK